MSERTGQYDYERLGEKPFQKLCNALLAHCFPEIRCFPVGHSDGGRDAVLPTDEGRCAIYQVKWTSRPTRDPVAWLTQTVKEERANIERLVSEGAQAYYLLTSIAGTAVPRTGTMDRLDVELAKYSKEFGIPMRAWWRADIDARVDAAPDAIKWAYSDMLAGRDLVRYLIEGENAQAYDHALRTLVMKVIATQWEEDAKVKFKQAELTSHDLAGLFIDVEAVRTSQARSTRGLQMSELSQPNVGGAAKYLLSTRQPFTLVRGEPGQGKSTLGQYLCQSHRAALLKKQGAGLASLPQGVTPKVPLRIDLRDYAAWLEGGDPLEEHLDSRRKAPRRKASLEEFVAYLLRARSGGLDADVATVNDISQRLPLLVIFDGLDEVARAETRTLVVKHINEFSARLPHDVVAPQVVVTTRPNAAGLAEPSSDMFETIALSHLKPELRTTYLRKWAAARLVIGRERRELERVFDKRSAEPHIAQLADNPMQLTILLYLLQRRRNSVPTGRTELYTSYMETFLDREAEKSPQVEEHRRDLEEVTAFLGWLLQSDAERLGEDGRITLRALQRAILTYLFDADKNQGLVDDLFTAVTDRVWALTSKIQGTFEFDVQPLREYFAARFLYEYAGAEQRDFDSSRVLQHLVRRPYWMNVARFYAGFARNNELAGLVDALEEEKESRQQPLQVLTAAWTLLADGVFGGRPRSQQRAAQLVLDDLSVRLLATQIRYAHNLPTLTADRGGKEVAKELCIAIDQDPASPLAGDRAVIASRLLSGSLEFETWWSERLTVAAGSSSEKDWLALGAATGAGSSRVPAAPLALVDTTAAAAAVEAGLKPLPGSDTESAMLHAVLAGHCNDVVPIGSSYPADLLRVLAPQLLLGKAAQKDRGFPFRLSGIHTDPRVSRTQQQSAWQRLVRRDPTFRGLQQALKGRRGEQRTTSVWADTAQAISAIFGPCWLAAQTAVIGACAPTDVFVTGGLVHADSQPLGPHTDYSRLLQEIRLYRRESSWWSDQFEQHTDALSRGTWALALVAAASPTVLAELASRLDEATCSLPDTELQALLATSSMLALSNTVGRLLPREVQDLAKDVSAPTALLLAYSDLAPRDGCLSWLTESQLAAMSCYGQAAWPAVAVLSARMMRNPSQEVLEALRAHGPRAVTLNLPMDHMDFDALASELLQQIIDAPADYPSGWVWAAQEVLASPVTLSTDNSVHPYLADVAAAEGWFSTDNA